MKKTKKMLSLFLAILIVVTMLPSSVLAATAGALYEVLLEPSIGGFFNSNAVGDVAVVRENVYYIPSTGKTSATKPSDSDSFWQPMRLIRYTGSSVSNVSDRFQYIFEFSAQGYAMVRDFDDKYGIIKSDGTFIVELGKYDILFDPSDDGYAVGYNWDEDAYYLLNLNNKTDTPTDQRSTYFSSGLTVVGDYSESNGWRFHYENVSGNRLSAAEYTYASRFSNGYAGVRTVGQDVYQIINTSGNTVLTVPKGYWPSGNVSKEGIFAVSNSPGRYGYMDLNGELIVSCNYINAGMFQNGYAVVQNTSYAYGMIGSNGGIVIPFGTYDSLSNASNTNLVWAANGDEDSTDKAILRVRLGSNLEPGIAQWSSLSPANGSKDVEFGSSAVFQITFDRDISSFSQSNYADLNFDAGTIKIYKSSDDKKPIYEAKCDEWLAGRYNFSGAGTTDIRVINYTTLQLSVDNDLFEYETTYYITLDEGFVKFLDGSVNQAINKGEWIFTTISSPVLPAHPAIKKSGTFSYLSNIIPDAKYQYSYNEEWFSSSAYEYQHELTQMSLRVAMAAFGKSDSNPSEDNIKTLMKELQFDNEDFHYPIPTNESIGYAIGSKNIKFKSGEESSLILVAIRGGGYTKEWGGNFWVGSSDTHAGFSFSAQQVSDGLNNYISKYKETFCSDVKIWIVGYSRAAATANLVAARLDDGAIKGIRPENVFAFCFECPQNTRALRSSTKYNNIVNIVNPIDFVTKVVMSQWGYGRYGITYFLPSKETTKNYNTLKKNMLSSYANILEYNKLGYTDAMAALYADEKNGQASTLDDFMDNLAEEFISPMNYFYNHEVNVMDIVTKTLGKEGGLLGDPGSFLVEIVDLGSLLKSHPFNSLSTISLFTKGYASQAHYPELCLAWLDSLNGNYANAPDDFYPKAIYRKVYVNCPVDILVYDSMDQVVAQIENGEVQEIEDGVIAYIDDDNQNVIILPIDEKYSIKLTATDAGTVTYTATEYSVDTGEIEKVVSYYAIAVTAEDQLTGDIENLNESGSAKYPLYLNDNKESLKATIDQSGSDVAEYTVAVATAGNGVAFGGGSYVSGEFTKVTAEADTGEAFLGWYINSKLVSSELEYRFLVDDDVEIVARFTTYTSQNPGGSPSIPGTPSYQITVPSTSNGTVTVTPTAAKSGTQVTITAIPDNGYEVGSVIVRDGSGNAVTVTNLGNNQYSFTMPGIQVTVDVTFVAAMSTTVNPFVDIQSDSYYYDAVLWAYENGVTTGTGDGTTFSPDDGCTRAQFVTFLWRAANKPEPVSSVNNFSDVSATAHSDYYKAILWAAEQGITTGSGDGTTFSPDEVVTRAQSVTFMHRYAKLVNIATKTGGTGFDDVINEGAMTSYYDAIGWAVANGITNGNSTTANTFGPMDKCNRAMMVTFLYRLFTDATV